MAELKVDNVLFKFLQNIHYKTLFQQEEEQIKDLEKGVKDIIQKIIDVFYSDGKYNFEELIHVGSSYEGSKIISPDEFDFMLVLKDLSEPGKVYIEPGCQPGMKLLRYKLFERSDSKGPNLVLNNMLGLEIDSIMTNSEVKREKQKKIRVQTSLGELRIKHMLRYTLHLDCISKDSSFDIKVDLMPSVRLPRDCKEIIRDMTTCPSSIRDLAFKDGCFLVGKFCVIDGMCWQLSFAAAERKMMKSLSPGHMKIYRVLKYLFVEKSLLGICDLMSSYILKTAVLRHTYFECEGNKATGCFVNILRSLATSIGSAFMKSLFLPSLNLWQRVVHEKMRNITENDTICDKSVRVQLSHIITKEGKELQDALIISVIFDFWKRIFLLLADLWESAIDGSVKLSSIENTLRTIYTKLNEEDEEDDIDKDYFKQETDGDKAFSENDWQISWPVTKAIINAFSESSTSSQQHEQRGSKLDDGSTNVSLMDIVDEEDINSEEKSQDLKDIEQFVNYYVEKTGEICESDEESSADTHESHDDDDYESSDDEMFVQAHQEDVYAVYSKYRNDISAVDIPVFSILLQQISEAEPCKAIQTIVERFRGFQRTSDSNDHIENVKRQKLDDD